MCDAQVCDYIGLLFQQGVTPDEIGVICAYEAQCVAVCSLYRSLKIPFELKLKHLKREKRKEEREGEGEEGEREGNGDGNIEMCVTQGTWAEREIMIGVIDDFQNLEKKYILISTVLSDSSLSPSPSPSPLHPSFTSQRYFTSSRDFPKSEILNNSRGFLVSMTRACVHTIVIGHPKILWKDPNWRGYLDFSIRNGGCVGIQRHGLEDGGAKEKRWEMYDESDIISRIQSLTLDERIDIGNRQGDRERETESESFEFTETKKKNVKMWNEESVEGEGEGEGGEGEEGEEEEREGEEGEGVGGEEKSLAVWYQTLKFSMRM